MMMVAAIIRATILLCKSRFLFQSFQDADKQKPCLMDNPRTCVCCSPFLTEQTIPDTCSHTPAIREPSSNWAGTASNAVGSLLSASPLLLCPLVVVVVWLARSCSFQCSSPMHGQATPPFLFDFGEGEQKRAKESDRARCTTHDSRFEWQTELGKCALSPVNLFEWTRKARD